MTKYVQKPILCVCVCVYLRTASDCWWGFSVWSRDCDSTFSVEQTARGLPRPLWSCVWMCTCMSAGLCMCACVCAYATATVSLIHFNIKKKVESKYYVIIFQWNIVPVCLIRSERGRVCVCVPFSATCFTSGQKTGACFHTENHQVYNMERGCLFASVWGCVWLFRTRGEWQSEEADKGDSGALSYNPLVLLKYINHALQPIPACHVVLASHWRIAI